MHLQGINCDYNTTKAIELYHIDKYHDDITMLVDKHLQESKIVEIELAD
jgi:hypothetical protein